MIQNEQLDILIQFVRNRERARMGKVCGLKKPWTTDPIIQQYRFCNVNREDDTVTKYIRDRWSERGYWDTWFSLVVGRILNQPESLDKLIQTTPVTWREDEFISSLRKHQEKGGRVFNSAYIVSTAGAKGCKIEYYAKRVLTPIWDSGKNFCHLTFPTRLEEWYTWLTQFRSIGPFIANQIVTDMRYHDMAQAPDWETFVMPGPGTMRGLNRLHNRPVDRTFPLKQGQEEILELKGLLRDVLISYSQSFVDPNNVSNCLCEFDKYSRVYNNEGKTPKQKYKGI